MARVHGYDSWRLLNAQLCCAPAAEPTALSGAFLDGHIVGISKLEAAMRLRHHAERTSMSAWRAMYVFHLARACFERIDPGSAYCDVSVATLIETAETLSRGSRDVAVAAKDLRSILAANDSRELPPIRHRLHVNPGPEHAEPGAEWQPLSALPDDTGTSRPHMAVIARDDHAASLVIRHYWQRGKLVSEVPNDHRPSEHLVDAVERHFGLEKLARSEDARDFVQTVVWSVVGNRLTWPDTLPESLILSVPWRPHDTDASLFLAQASRLKIRVVVRITPARYSGTAKDELDRVMDSCGTLVLGANTVMPDFVPGRPIANRGDAPIFRPNPMPA